MNAWFAGHDVKIPLNTQMSSLTPVMPVTDLFCLKSFLNKSVPFYSFIAASYQGMVSVDK